MVDSFINKQKSKENGYNTTQCLKMFGVSDSGYYAWRGRREDKNGKCAQKKAERDGIKEKMRQIIVARNGVIPGKRTFRVELFRRYGLTVNTKRIAAIMKEMNLVAQMPHKDAYKHQASHNHVCAAPANAVNREFFIGPRRVIFTDVTYLYYGEHRSLFYQYATTGIYPLKSYFGVPASVMMTGGDLKKVRRRYADEEAAKRRTAAARKREAKRLIHPEQVIQRDRRLLENVIEKWKDKKEVATIQLTKMEQLLERVEEAQLFIRQLTTEKLEELREPLAWRKYEELNYVFAMNELF